MAETLVISSGVSDSQLYLQNAVNAAAPFNIEPSSGNYPMVGNMLVNRKLASRWLAVNLASRAFVDGLGVSSYGAEAENVGMLRIPLLYMPPRLKRTLSSTLCPSGTADGTPGNGEPFNKNLPHGMQTDAYDIKFMQEYDEAAIISRTNMRLVGSSLDALGEYTNNIPKTVALLQDADILATHIGAGLTHASKTGNKNLIAYDSTETAEGYLQGLLNTLVSKLANVQGAYKEGIISYDPSKSVIVMRWSLFNKVMTIKQGAVINSDIGQKILLNGYLDDSGTRLLGNYIYGKYNGVYIKVLPDEMFDTAAATLGLSAAQYAEFNKVVAYIANADGTIFGQSANVTEINKSPTTSLGFVVQNDWGWGVKCVRPSSIALVVAAAANFSDFTNPVTSFEDITSPANMEGLIEGYQSADESEHVVQRIGITVPDLVTAVTLTVNDGASPTPAAITDAEVTVRREDGTYATVGNNGDGTYSFVLPRVTTATVAIAADGFVAATVSVTAVNTAGATYAVTKSLTAES